MRSKSLIEVLLSVEPEMLLAFIALFLSLVSPIISALINGVFSLVQRNNQLKDDRNRRKFDFYEQHRAEVIERYIREAGRASKLDTKENLAEFGSVMGEIFLYTDKSLWPSIEKINAKLNMRTRQDASEELEVLCKELSLDGIRSAQGAGKRRGNGKAPE